MNSLEYQTTTHIIKSYLVWLKDGQEDYVIKAPIGNILELQVPSDGKRLLLILQHSSRFSGEKEYHIKAVEDNIQTYLNGYKFCGRTYVSSYNKVTETTTTKKLNVFIEISDVEYPTY